MAEGTQGGSIPNGKERQGFFPEENAVFVTSGWVAKEGEKLIDNLFLGRILGAGMQGQIFELKDGAGTIAPIVLKAAKKAALISDLEREWGVGQKVATLADENGNLPGFMKVGPALRRPDGKIVGQVLERVNGKSISAIIKKKSWADIHYLRSMLLEVLTGIDKAQRAFGFHHCDFRLENVMEHTPNPDHHATDAISMAVLGDPTKRSYARQFKTIDYGLAKYDDWYSAAHGWLMLEAQGRGIEAQDQKRLALPEWIHHTAWKGKGDVYHIIFDTTLFLYGRTFPAEDRRTVELLIMLIAHICGVKPKVWFHGANGMVEDLEKSQISQTKYAIPEKKEAGAGKVLQDYQKWSRVNQWARQLKAWRWPKNPGVTGAEVLTSPFFSPYATTAPGSMKQRTNPI